MQDNVTRAKADWEFLRDTVTPPPFYHNEHAWSVMWSLIEKRLASTTAQTEAVQKLVDALEAISQHAGHTEECSFYWDGGQSCDCGYLAAHVKKAQALAAHRESQP